MSPSQQTSADQPLKDKTCVVTGATSGIGQAASIALARLGARLVLVGRDPRRGEAALAAVAAAASTEPALELADLAVLDQVRDLANRLGKLPAIDVLVNNAGLVGSARQITPDGIEHTMAVNHLAPFALTNLLLPTLEAAGRARVVTVSSAAHRGARLNLDDLNCEHGYSAMRAYANSKLANILFTRELARRLTAPAMTANCLHPGTVRTRFGQSGSPWMRFGLQLGAPLLRSPESGAATLIHLASSPRVDGATGGYYVSSKRREPSRAARDDQTAARLWEISAKLTGVG